MMVISDSVRPTAAIACEPRPEMKSMSTMANTDSITISNTIGIEISRIAWPRLPLVYSCFLPRSASLMLDHKELGAEGL